jgi:outer membrane receptor protein involved in Fe transport
MHRFYMRSAASMLAVAVAISVSAPAHAQSRNFNVPAQPASQGVREFARQAGIQITLAGRDGERRRTNTVQGALEIREALDQLLQGTGLIVRSFDGEAAVIAVAAGRVSAENGEFGGEVVVTAQKITERLIDVPISVSAFTAQDLSDQKIEGGPELLRGIPNVSFSKDNFSGYNFTIRGIGTKAISTTADPAVAISFNYTPLIRNRLFEQEYFDVERVEVLRGPQGTLYGRNATAGVVNMLPAKPRLGRWDGEIQGEVGNYQTTRLRGFVNVPIGDTLAVRAAAAWTKRDGFDFNTVSQKQVNGRDLYSIRLSALWEPDPRMRFSFFWEHFNEDDDRSRTGKQLCTRGETPKTIDYADQAGVARSAPVFTAWTMSTVTPGCQNKTLFSDDAYGVPNGIGFPIVTPLILALPGRGSNGPYGSYWTDVFLDPFATADGRQSRNLREISTFYDPVYRARNDLFQLNAELDLSDDLHFTSQTLYTKDRYSASQDFFRFQAKPYFTAPEAYIPRNPGGPRIVPEWVPYLGSRDGLGTFKDPQLGELTVPAAVDLSQASSEQWSQEVRLNSSFDGPINFNAGANYLSYKTEENYYVFSNLFTAAAIVEQSSGFYCNKTTGEGCVYIDPNPLGSINGDGHNYYRNIQDLKTTSWSAFGEVYWKPVEDLKVTVGLRYTNDRKRITLYPTQLLASTGGISGGTIDRGYPAQSVDINRWRRLTGRLAIDWKPRLPFTSETLVYASYARGYKGGGDNPIGRRGVPCPADSSAVINYICAEYTQLPTDFEPEEINSFEIGMKNKIAGGKVLLNIAAFYNDYKNYQISQLIDRMIGTENFDATSYGVELEAAWVPSRHFRVGATLGYLRTRIGNGQSSIDVMDRLQGHDDWIIIHPWADSPNSCVAPKELVGAYIAGTDMRLINRPKRDQIGSSGIKKFCETSSFFAGGRPVPGTGFVKGQLNSTFTYNPLAPYDPRLPSNYYSNTPSNYGAPNQGRGFSADVSGNELPNAPRLTFNVGAQYTFFLDDWELSFRGDYYRQSRSYARIYNTDYDRLQAWGNANAAITLSRPESNLTYQIYVKNVFNSTPITDAFTGPDELGNFTNVFTLDPRIIGFNVRVGF